MKSSPKLRWTIPELERARVLAFEVGLPAGSIAKLLTYEYGRARSSDTVRYALRKYFKWKGTPHGDPSAIRRKAN